MRTSGEYHEYIRGSSVHWGFQYKLTGLSHLSPPHASYLPNVLNITQCTHDIPQAFVILLPYMDPDIPQCTEHPLCTHDISLMYSWYLTAVLMISIGCTCGISLMY